MTDYIKIINTCKESARISDALLDNFLINLVAEREGLNKPMAQKLARYKQVVNIMPQEWLFRLSGQYLAHRLFKKDGLASKVLNYSAMKFRTAEELAFLEFQIQNPWRYVFCSVEKHPTKAFFQMKDSLTEEDFLLYSPGLEELLGSDKVVPTMLFFLIGFNGACYQTYGPLVYFRGIQPFDVFYFAKQLQPDIVFTSDVPAAIEKDPIPFAMLFSGAELPMVVTRGDMMVFNQSEYHMAEFNPASLSDAFAIKERQHVYMMSLKGWSEFPHFAACYYHSKHKRFFICAMTDRGYTHLVKALLNAGHTIPEQPDHRATGPMIELTRRILGKTLEFSPYEKIFREKEPTSAEKKELKVLNDFTKLLIDAYNNKQKYSIEALAAKAGLDVETAMQVEKQLMKKFEDMMESGANDVH